MCCCFGVRSGFAVFIFFFSFFSAAVVAHPHQFIETHVDIVFDEEGLNGFRVKWIFDEMTAATILMDYDQNENELLEPLEVATLKREQFDKLAELNYLIYIYVGDQDYRVKEVENFAAYSQDLSLEYEFFVPCRVVAERAYQTVRLSIFDEEYYTEYTIRNNTIRTSRKALYDFEYILRTADDRYYYYGNLHPIEIAMRFKRSK